MTCGKVSKRNRLLRERAFNILDQMKIGDRLKSSKLSQDLSTNRMFVLPRTIGNFLKEREDFKSDGKGWWTKVSDKATMDAVK